ncbi:MAG: hypothetical protein COY39_00830 [Alphaproteobacteria bacterium CG_4_10_14_0_8_um_filter_37_21]|nr:MAG: hypothetical protein COY39_00830 [Alphaproteobacteria bacterium CG_4_10_14_0_8_um_filter_37_21]
MAAKIKRINIVPYSPLWPKNFSDEAQKIQHCFGDNCTAIHHIGSTAVAGLRSKDTIDILCIVKNLKNIKNLELEGYIAKGELNIPLRYYYSNNTIEPRINLHICEQDHGFVELNLSFRDYLRQHTKIRDEYAELKQTILKSETASDKPQGCFSNYNLKKDAFIKDVLRKCQFSQYSVTFCMHVAEQEACKCLLQIDDAKLNEYFKDENAFIFCLYQGEKIIGSCLMLIENQRIQTIKYACNKQDTKKEDLLYFKSFINKWAFNSGYASYN